MTTKRKRLSLSSFKKTVWTHLCFIFLCLFIQPFQWLCMQHHCLYICMIFSLKQELSNTVRTTVSSRLVCLNPTFLHPSEGDKPLSSVLPDRIWMCEAVCNKASKTTVKHLVFLINKDHQDVSITQIQEWKTNMSQIVSSALTSGFALLHSHYYFLAQLLLCLLLQIIP